jgi:hypothetical protein
MYILRDFNLSRLILVISLSLISLATLFSIGYCDDWVFVTSNEDFTQYYDSSSVKIDKQNKTIEVWVKLVFSDKGKIDFLENKGSKIKHKYIDINYQLKHYLLNYNELKSSISFISYYSKSDKLLFHREYIPEWKNIIPDNYLDKLIYKLLEDYNIQR